MQFDAGLEPATAVVSSDLPLRTSPLHQDSCQQQQKNSKFCGSVSKKFRKIMEFYFWNHSCLLCGICIFTLHNVLNILIYN